MVVMEWRDGDNHFTTTKLTPTLFVTRGYGVISGDAVERFIAMLDREIAGGAKQISFFHDWEHIDSYDPAMRKRLTEWRRNNPAGITKAIHILVRSKLVAMGVAASAVLLRMAGIEIESYAYRDSFERALRSAVDASR
jgi:hypothetical protein